VLLKNAHHILPLSTHDRVYVAGSNADNLGAQTGGWTLLWQGQPGAITDPGTTILQGIKAKDASVTYSPTASAPTTGSDVGVVVVGEHPYAEGQVTSATPASRPTAASPASISRAPITPPSTRCATRCRAWSSWSPGDR
jgi:hypothetical protein